MIIVIKFCSYKVNNQCNNNIGRSVGNSSPLGTYDWLVGLIAGIIVGVVIAIALVCIVYFVKKRKRKVPVNSYLYYNTGAKNLMLSIFHEL